MQRLSSYTFLLFFTLITFSQCKLDSLDETIIVADVDEEFYIDFWEDLSPEGSSFAVLVETIDEEECLNYFIDTDSWQSGSRVRVSINEIIAPDDCQAGTSTVKEKVVLGPMNAGLYDFSIDLKSTALSEGQLTITGNRYLIEFASEKGIKLVRSELLRVPEKAIWGYVGYELESDSTSANKFLDELAAVSVPADYTKGYYGHFTLNPDNTIQLKVSSASNHSRNFVFQYQDQQEELVNFLEEQRMLYEGVLDIKVTNGKGEDL